MQESKRKAEKRRVTRKLKVAGFALSRQFLQGYLFIAKSRGESMYYSGCRVKKNALQRAHQTYYF